MKIVYLHQYFNTPDKPGGSRSYEMGRRLAAAGHEVHIITSDRSPKRRRYKKYCITQESGMIIHWLHVPYEDTFGYKRRVWAFLQFAFKAALIAKKTGGDLVFASSTPLTIILPAHFAAKLNGLPLVFEVRDLWPELPIAVGVLKNPFLIRAAKWLEKFAYKKAKRIIALSPGMKEEVVRRGMPEAKVITIPNSCDVERFTVSDELGCDFRAKRAWLQDRPLIVYIGAIGLMNGLDYFVYLAKKVSEIDPEVRFLLVGSGREEHKVRRLAVQLGIYQKNFFMLPPVAKKDIPKILNAADIATSFVINLRELWNNSANKFFDALASGRPVAINYRGWQAELLEQTGAGIVLHPTQTEEATGALLQKLKDPGWLRNASSAAKFLAYNRFNRDLLAAKLESTLKQAQRDWKQRQDQKKHIG